MNWTGGNGQKGLGCGATAAFRSASGRVIVQSRGICKLREPRVLSAAPKQDLKSKQNRKNCANINNSSSSSNSQELSNTRTLFAILGARSGTTSRKRSRHCSTDVAQLVISPIKRTTNTPLPHSLSRNKISPTRAACDSDDEIFNADNQDYFLSDRGNNSLNNQVEVEISWPSIKHNCATSNETLINGSPQLAKRSKDTAVLPCAEKSVSNHFFMSDGIQSSFDVHKSIIDAVFSQKSTPLLPIARGGTVFPKSNSIMEDADWMQMLWPTK
ncbi:hypothetical protein HK100_009598 [Physocladia obscura]|uniref:Uncharacterized protein n=1 Tax=Physocladia obscura TaxID=109957 RepID=A0AAD5T967_9FUNG|nr:hypothetical protein HK100_009598 [Physocladia obscura]